MVSRTDNLFKKHSTMTQQQQKKQPQKKPKLKIPIKKQEQAVEKELSTMTEINIPDLDIEDFEIPEDKDNGVESTHGASVEVALIGTGQGGSRIAEAFYKMGYKKCIVVNTAQHDLHHIKVPDEQKFHMKMEQAGAGKDMENGKAAAEAYRQQIYDLMMKTFGHVERILVTVGAGGGTGGGSCTTIIEVAKKYLTYIGYNDVEKRVGAIVALPTAGECSSVVVAKNASTFFNDLMQIAEAGKIAPVIVVDNDKIDKMYPRLTVKNFWPTVNNTIAGLYHTFNIIATHSSNYTTFDPADYNSLLSLPGCMVMGCTTVKDATAGTDISNAIKTNLEKTLLAKGFDLSTAKGVGCVVIGGSDIFEQVEGLMASIEYGFDTIANLVGTAIVHRGIYEVGKGRLRVYTLMSGLDTPTERITELQRFHKR